MIQVEIFLIIFGGYFLLVGETRLSKNVLIKARPARLAGALLLSPFLFPCAFGVLMGLGLLPATSLEDFATVYVVVVIVAIAAAGLMVRWGATTIPPDEQGRIDDLDNEK